MKKALFLQIHFVLCLLHAYALYANPHVDSLPLASIKLLNEVLSNYFELIPEHEIKVDILRGGHSNTSLLITAKDRRYVLRIKKEQTRLPDLKCELFAMREAARLGIGPQIFYVNNDCRAMLMDYIPVPTLTVHQAHQTKNIVKIAQTLAKVHQMAPNPYPTDTGPQAAIALYNSLSSHTALKSELDQAAELVQKYEAELAKTNTYPTTTHGELNPRNILLYEDKVFFIDWEYTGLEDPFMDLSYLALRLDYTTQEELLFLENYLHRIPYKEEIERYYLAKKLNYAQLVIFFFYFALREKEIEKSIWDTVTPLKPYEYYVKIFVDRPDSDISLSQFYYDLARWCLQRTK